MKELFKKYIKRECSQEEIQQIIAYLKKEQGLSEVPTIEEVSKILESYPDLEESVANRIFGNILKSSNSNKIAARKIIPFWKYTAAAVFIGIISTGYFFKDRIFSKSVTTTMANNDVLPGKSKAILTLADGSTIALEKGNKYYDTSVKCDGEKIVYEKEQQVSEIEYNYLTIPRGGEFLIKLSDGTQVWLNSESQLKYPTKFEKGETRVVELVYGEAYFDVSPSTNHNGSKFVVSNQSQEIEVIGTEFNVKAYKEEARIFTTLVEGKVKVSNTALSEYLLPSQQINLNIKNNTFSEVATVDVSSVVSWKEGVFSFRRKSLLEISKVLSRWYDVDFTFNTSELKNKGFNGVLGKDQNLKEILNSFIKLKAIKNYEIKNKEVILK